MQFTFIKAFVRSKNLSVKKNTRGGATKKKWRRRLNNKGNAFVPPSQCSESARANTVSTVHTAVMPPAAGIESNLVISCNIQHEKQCSLLSFLSDKPSIFPFFTQIFPYSNQRICWRTMQFLYFSCIGNKNLALSRENFVFSLLVYSIYKDL